MRNAKTTRGPILDALNAESYSWLSVQAPELRISVPIGKNAKNISGQRYGRLIAINPIRRTKASQIVWLCRCDCGAPTEAIVSNLRNGHTQSCGCLRIDVTVTRSITHGMSNRPEYWIWSSMIERCINSNNVHYADYGGRGVVVCERWQTFEGFYADMGKRPSPDLTLDRIDNDSGYGPDNCQWATGHDQANNRRSNHLLTYNGETLTLAQWSRRIGINSSTLTSRIGRGGWSTERALTEPIRGNL